jgi:DNA-binding MarR family transcriptional regulator
MESSSCNCTWLRSATRTLTQVYDEALRPTGLRVTQFSILHRTDAVGTLPLSELADLMATDRTTMARNLQVLERDGFIKISIGEDRRERLIQLTPLGRRTLAGALPVWESIQRRFERKLGGAKEAKALRDIMQLIVATGRELSEELGA